jgi:uncharacterized protein (DUF983 family)
MQSWFVLRARCTACGTRFQRGEDQDYWLGAYLLNFIVIEVLFAVLLAVVLVATWPNPPWSFVLLGGAAQMILTPIVFYPFAKALWLMADLVFRSPGPDDFAPDRDAG